MFKKNTFYHFFVVFPDLQKAGFQTLVIECFNQAAINVIRNVIQNINLVLNSCIGHWVLF